MISRRRQFSHNRRMPMIDFAEWIKHIVAKLAHVSKYVMMLD